VEDAPTRIVTATIRRVIYRAPGSRFRRRRSDDVRRRGVRTAAGLLGDPSPESTYKLDEPLRRPPPRFGPRFKVASAIPVTPDTLDGMRRYWDLGPLRGHRRVDGRTDRR
jgi:hypothetical protein